MGVANSRGATGVSGSGIAAALETVHLETGVEGCCATGVEGSEFMRAPSLFSSLLTSPDDPNIDLVGVFAFSLIRSSESLDFFFSLIGVFASLAGVVTSGGLATCTDSGVIAGVGAGLGVAAGVVDVGEGEVAIEGGGEGDEGGTIEERMADRMRTFSRSE
jgi:hypothetical protein